MIKKVLAWVWVALALIMALGAVSPPNQVPVAAIVLLASALLSFPLPDWSAWWAKSPVAAIPRPAVAAVVGIVGVVVLGANTKPADKTAQVASESAAPSPSASPSPSHQVTSATAEVNTAMKAYYRDVINRITPCDDAVGKIAKVAAGLKSGTADAYDGYAAAKSADDSCFAAFMELGRVEVPDALEDVAEEEADKALEACRNAAVLKRSTAQAASEIFNGDTRPSALNEFEESSKSAQAAGMVCVVKLIETASTAKVDLTLLK